MMYFHSVREELVAQDKAGQAQNKNSWVEQSMCCMIASDLNREEIWKTLLDEQEKGSLI